MKIKIKIEKKCKNYGQKEQSESRQKKVTAYALRVLIIFLETKGSSVGSSFFGRSACVTLGRETPQAPTQRAQKGRKLAPD